MRFLGLLQSADFLAKDRRDRVLQSTKPGTVAGLCEYCCRPLVAVFLVFFLAVVVAVVVVVAIVVIVVVMAVIVTVVAVFIA